MGERNSPLSLLQYAQSISFENATPRRHKRMQSKTTLSKTSRQRLKGKFLLAGLLLGLTLVSQPGRADETDEVSKLIQQGALDKALARTDAYLASRPKDPQMRFLKGLILAERNKANEAIVIFTKLTEDYPELPEPYNNLAVLYAGRGEYDKAREALEMAIRTHPSYATAHENLGDIYAKMASQSYDKALQLDNRNQTAQTKLAMVRNLIAGKPLPESAPVAAQTPAAGKTKPSSGAAQDTLAQASSGSGKTKDNMLPPPSNTTTGNKTKAPVADYSPAPSPQSHQVISSAPTVQEPPKSNPTTSGALSASKPTPPAPIAPPKNTIGSDTQVLAAVERWAKAWSSQDIKTYLDSYSQEFDTPGKMSRKNWEKQREERIVGKETIRVVVENPSITITGDRAVVKFKQSYYSNRLNNISMKILNLKLEGSQWRIVNERVGG
jgi:tetratricopeptide (TPR) repeat protein